MKKLLCVVLSILLLVPFGTAMLALHAGADDVFKAEDSSNTAFAEYSAKNSVGASISGRIKVAISLNNGGSAILSREGESDIVATIAADGTYAFSNVPVGEYNLVLSVPGFTNYTVYDINASEGEIIEIYENTIVAGDANKSDVIDLNDVAAVITYLGQSVNAANIGCDIDHDGAVSVSDISTILSTNCFLEEASSSYYLNNGYTMPC